MYLPSVALSTVCDSAVYSHLLYGAISWGSAASSTLNKLQVKQNRLIKIIIQSTGRRIKLQPLYRKAFILQVKEIFRLEVVKFMAKLHVKNLCRISFVYLVKLLTFIIKLLAFHLKIYTFLEMIMLKVTNLLQFSVSKFGIASRAIFKKWR